jgi:membrane protein implicated in regulation of membrane protease activity
MTTAPLSWLILGLILIAISLVIPNPITAAFGFAGLITALVALSVPILAKQLLIWAILSGAILLIFYGLVPQNSKSLESAQQAEVAVPILAGKVGKVMCNGVQWNARCQISDAVISAGQTVTIVGRQGNTLIVLPFVH